MESEVNTNNRKTAPRVLLADDDPVIRHWLTSILEREGYEVVSMSDGREAYQVLQRDADFKGAVFDLSMPYLEGPDLIRHMRTEKRLMRIPVMMISAESDIKVLSQGMAAGATFLLPKPFTKAQLQGTLRMMLGTNTADSEASSAAGNRRTSVTEKGQQRQSSSAPEMETQEATSIADQPVDLEVLKSLETGEDEDAGLITELIDLYLESAEREVKAIKLAAREQNKSSLKARAHSLRGSSLTIGAGNIAKVCEQLEDPAGTNSRELIDELVGTLQSEFVATRRVLVNERIGRQ